MGNILTIPRNALILQCIPVNSSKRLFANAIKPRPISTDTSSMQQEDNFFDQSIFARNSGYVSREIQEKICNTTLLIAGCGVGSQFAVAAARLGVKNFILVDGDTVEITNLNRQAYFFSDIGQKKVLALAQNIKNINPVANVEVHDSWLTHKNVKTLVKSCDVIFDTIDFLDMPAILALHDAANTLNKKILSAFSAGWGACLVSIMPNPGQPCFMQKVFGIDKFDPTLSYTDCFKKFYLKIQDHLPLPVQKDMLTVLQKMADNKPCPASHTVTGALTVAAICTAALYKILSNEPFTTNELILVDFEKTLQSTGIKLK